MLYSEEEKAVIDRALQIIESKLTVKGAALTSPELAADFCRLHLATLEHELFAIILLDYQNRFIKYVELFRGSIASAAVYPREVVKEALTVNAASCLLLHNHPSGDATPSEADKKITRQLQAALELVDIRVLDHIIVGGLTTTSFAESGLL